MVCVFSLPHFRLNPNDSVLRSLVERFQVTPIRLHRRVAGKVAFLEKCRHFLSQMRIEVALIHEALDLLRCNLDLRQIELVAQITTDTRFQDAVKLAILLSSSGNSELRPGVSPPLAPLAGCETLSHPGAARA